MDMVSPILDVATRLWNCTSGHASYITSLQDTLISLRTKMGRLKDIRDDVKVKVQLEEEQGKIQSKQVEGWLKRVEETEIKVHEILSKHDEIKTNGLTCLKICECRSSYKLGKESTRLLNDILELMSQSVFEELANHEPLPNSSTTTKGLFEMPMENTVGIDTILENVMEHLKDEKVGIIGLFGMGGVGKTTLLKRINNELLRSGDDSFDVALRVVASKQATVEGIQQNILEQLKIPFHLWTDKHVDEKAVIIYQALKGQKYILMLDDLWDRLSLSEVGLPSTSNDKKSKVIFTTRSEEICGLMEAHLKIKVTCLSWEKAWDLFRDKVGEDVLSCHNDIPRLAELVAKECDGLPLALITIGRAMSSRKTPYEWSHALNVLRKYPSKFSGMGEHVLPVLKFSYDNLPDQTIKECFVYCCLFPEDYEIPVNKLVDLWIGEGILNEFDDIIEARNHGIYVIESLKLASLLECGVNSHVVHVHVKMHDVIRDMAIWIASDLGKSNGKFLVFDKTGLTGIQSGIKDWYNEVEKMFLCGTMVKEPLLTCLCPQLSTLVINDTNLREIPSSLFQFIPFVRVLDLSRNKWLAEMPNEISTLTLLEYLDLSRTSLYRLPLDLKSLSRLRYLLLNYLENIKVFPSEIISNLTNLLVFRMNCPKIRNTTMVDLDSFKNINETAINLKGTRSLEKFLKLKNLQRSVRYLRIGYSLTSDMVDLSDLENLEALQIIRSGLITLKMSRLSLEGFSKLKHVIISNCDSLKELDYLVYAPFLENLWVRKCGALQRIVCIHDNDVGILRVFSNLRRIRLFKLPSLEYICNQQLAFPSLERVYVEACPWLQLCFKDEPSTSNLAYIKGEQKWWNSLKWRNEGLRQQFSHYFISWNMLETINGPMLYSCDEWPDYSSDIIYSMTEDEENRHVFR